MSQAMHTVYSRYIDMSSDAKPRQFYAVGTNYSINGTAVDFWRLKYKSSLFSLAGSGWGTTTTINPLVFGYSSPTTFTALNNGGVNQGQAQYWMLTYDIDMVQSFAFPDSNQPTISKYEFFYSPGSNARLRNGRTFQDQKKQSLDAHP